MELGRSAVTVDVAGLVADRAMRRLAALLRAGVDPGARVSREWTVRDVAAHVAGFLPLYVRMVQGEPSPLESLDEVAEWNDRFLAVEERNVYMFADTIDREMAALLDAVADVEGDVAVEWHGGIRLPLSSLLGLLAGEGYVHGYDVARTARASWVIPAEDAAGIFHAAVPLFPVLVDEERTRGLQGTVELRLRGVEGGRWAFVFDGPSLTVERADGHRPDWILSVSPTGYLLTAYGRVSPIRAALSGRAAGWGRRPGVGLSFGRAFRSL